MTVEARIERTERVVAEFEGPEGEAAACALVWLGEMVGCGGMLREVKHDWPNVAMPAEDERRVIRLTVEFPLSDGGSR